MTIRDDHALAAELAAEAGERLLLLREREGFADPRALRDLGDASAHRYLADSLAARRPSDSVLSEEATQSERLASRRLTADRVWIIDPLDGTREFAEEGRADWAVHVALWERGELVAGAVALPAQGRTLSPPARVRARARRSRGRRAGAHRIRRSQDLRRAHR
jgi:3'(2'), 5'-bisphosphate nucleotidase